MHKSLHLAVHHLGILDLLHLHLDSWGRVLRLLLEKMEAYLLILQLHRRLLLGKGEVYLLDLLEMMEYFLGQM